MRRHSQQLISATTLFLLLIFLTGCGPLEKIQSDIDTAVTTFGRIGNSVQDISNTWEDFARKLVPELKEAGYELIANDLQQFANRTLMSANVQFLCNVEYFRRRSQQMLQSIKSAITIHINESKDTKAKMEVLFPPFICEPDPPYINLYLDASKRTNVTINGFDLENKDSDGRGLTVMYLRDDGRKQDLGTLRPSSFAMAIINISAMGTPVDQHIREIQLWWGKQLLSSIPIVGPQVRTVIIPGQMLPQSRPNHIGGGRNFGNSEPIITCKCNLEEHLGSNNSDTISAKVYMKAIGTGDNPPVAEGSDYFPLLTLKPGQHFKGFGGATYDQIDKPPTFWGEPIDWRPQNLSGCLDAYRKSPHLWLRPGRGEGLLPELMSNTTRNGLVSLWRIWGTRNRDDVEVYTGVQVWLNDINVEITEDASDSHKEAAKTNVKTKISDQLSPHFLPIQVRSH